MTAKVLDFQRRVPSRLRHTIGPWIDRVADRLGYPSYRVRPTEYAGTAHCSLNDLEVLLQDDGFSPAPFSLYHRPPAGTSPNRSWTYRSSVLADRQLHVILLAQSSETVDVYAHTESNPFRHPIKYVRQTGVDRAEGARRMRQWLIEHRIDFTTESRVARRITHLLERAREQVAIRNPL